MSSLHDEVRAAHRVAALPKILDVICRTTGMRYAVLARVTADRWIACSVQDNIPINIAPFQELEVSTTICHRVFESGRAVVVDEAASNEQYRDHPACKLHGFRSFISVPVVLPDGMFFGTLSALDREPRLLNTIETLRSFELFAELVALNLDRELQLVRSQDALAQERRDSELREQFIAVLGHDLRNPLSSIRTGTWVLKHDPSSAPEISDLIDQSVDRMSNIIDDVLDFARGRLGSGLGVAMKAHTDFAPTVLQVVRELQAGETVRSIDVQMDLTTRITCDVGRLGQLVSNLVGNALTHGSPLHDVSVSCGLLDDKMVLSVCNQGEPIPEEMIGNLFEPFFRANGVQSRKGLGLGLFIASEIAREHGGAIQAISSPAETRFTFTMPIVANPVSAQPRSKAAIERLCEVAAEHDPDAAHILPQLLAVPADGVHALA